MTDHSIIPGRGPCCSRVDTKSAAADERPVPIPELLAVAGTRCEFETGEVYVAESGALDCPRVVVVAFPVMDAICFPVRACLLMMRFEAASSAVVGLSLAPTIPLEGGAREGKDGGEGEEVMGGEPEDGAERGC